MIKITDYNSAAAVREWAKNHPESVRGTWHYRCADNSIGAHSIRDAEQLDRAMAYGEVWRLVSTLHPDDDTPAATEPGETIERFVVVTSGGESARPFAQMHDTSDGAKDAHGFWLSRGRRAHIERVLLHVPPEDPPLATVTGVVVPNV
jgi:hypothetical protein